MLIGTIAVIAAVAAGGATYGWAKKKKADTGKAALAGAGGAAAAGTVTFIGGTIVAGVFWPLALVGGALTVGYLWGKSRNGDQKALPPGE